MCIVSMVYDHYQPRIPQAAPWNPAVVTTFDPKATAELIEKFQRDRDAAKLLDESMGQPDCVDPDKAKLEARVAELEAQIKIMTEHARYKEALKRIARSPDASVSVSVALAEIALGEDA